jgi:hypothetical protein
MGFVVKWTSRTQGQYFFEVGWGGQHVSVGFKKFLEGLSNPDLTPQKFVKGCLMSTQVNFLILTRLIMMGWQPMMHPLTFIQGIAFYV